MEWSIKRKKRTGNVKLMRFMAFSFPFPSLKLLFLVLLRGTSIPFSRKDNRKKEGRGGGAVEGHGEGERKGNGRKEGEGKDKKGKSGKEGKIIALRDRVAIW